MKAGFGLTASTIRSSFVQFRNRSMFELGASLFLFVLRLSLKVLWNPEKSVCFWLCLNTRTYKDHKGVPYKNGHTHQCMTWSLGSVPCALLRGAAAGERRAGRRNAATGSPAPGDRGESNHGSGFPKLMSKSQTQNF